MANFSDLVSPLTISTINVGGGSNVTLTTAQTNAGTLLLTGALTANITVYFPARLKIWSVVNNTTGAFTITLAMTGGSTTISILQGYSREFYSDGTTGLYVLGSDITGGSATSLSATTLSVSGLASFTSTGALILPSGTTTQQPSSPVASMVRYNTTTGRFEFYNGTAWVNHVRLSGDTMTGSLTTPALVGSSTTATLDSYIIGSGTPLAATFTGVTLGTANALQWGTNAYLYGGTANILEQYNGTNSQIFNVYNTRTDASNYERGVLSWLSNTFSVGTEAAGTGTPRTLALRTNGSTRWIINANNGFLSPGTDATIDIGTTGARVRNLYTSGISVSSGTVSAVPTTGGTVAIAQQTNLQLIDPAGTLATLTVTLPTPVSDGHAVEISFSQLITSLTINSATGSVQAGTPTAINVVGSSLKFRYYAATTTWRMIEAAMFGSGLVPVVGGGTGATNAVAAAGNIGTFTIVSTIAALRNVSKTANGNVFVQGYYAANDGGGGAYVYVSTDTTSTDNGGSIIVASDGGRWYLQNTTRVSVKQFGAKGDGSTNDTTAWTSAMAVGIQVDVPAGNYILNQFTIPSTVKRLSALGSATLTPSGSVPSGATVATWITANNLSKSYITGFTLVAASATYPNLTCLSLGSCTRTEVSDLVFNGAGYTGISSALGTSNKILRNNVSDFKGTGIVIAGSSSSVLDTKTEVSGNYVVGNGASTVAHCISFQYCIDFNVHDNECVSGGTFNIGVYLCNYGRVHGNSCYDSIHEGINVQDSSFVKVQNNLCRWDSTSDPSIDFGICIYGAAVNCQAVTVQGNDVINSGSSGICFTGLGSFGVQYSLISDNNVVNCNVQRSGAAGGVDNLAGILLSGTQVQVNRVRGNSVVDLIGTLTYGISEHSFGNGTPTSNIISANDTYSSGGFLTADLQRTNTSTALAFNSGDMSRSRAYTPTATSTSGTITTYTAAGDYVSFGSSYAVYINVSITTAGTGAGKINVTLPFASTAGGALSGVETVSGKTVSGSIAAASSTCVLTFADGTYPGATGNNIVITGIVA